MSHSTTHLLGTVALGVGVLVGAPARGEEVVRVLDGFYEAAHPVKHESLVYTDEEIAAEIQRQIATDPRVGSFTLDADVDRGVVTLSGTVRHILLRVAAVEIAQGVRGVRAVEDEVTVVPEIIRADSEILDGLRRALSAEALLASQPITVRVTQGRVLVGGAVPTWAVRRLVVDTLMLVPGVKQVDDRLSVVPVEPVRPDRLLVSDVLGRLRRDGWLDASAVQVKVDKQRVTLWGTMESAVERARAIQDAQVNGVTGVDATHLAVDWSREATSRRRGGGHSYPDAAVALALGDRLRDDARLAGLRLHPVVDGGTATLVGVVPSWAAKLDAEDAAQDTPGVVHVDSRLEVVVARRFPDSVVSHSVAAALRLDPYTSRGDVTATVWGGAVLLRGSVGSAFELRRVVRVAARAPGVTGIDADLVARSNWGPEADARLARGTEKALTLSADWPGGLLDVWVNAGAVRLTGVVLGWRAWRAATRHAEFGKAAHVTNLIRILPSPPDDTASAREAGPPVSSAEAPAEDLGRF